MSSSTMIKNIKLMQNEKMSSLTMIKNKENITLMQNEKVIGTLRHISRMYSYKIGKSVTKIIADNLCGVIIHEFPNVTEIVCDKVLNLNRTNGALEDFYMFVKQCKSMTVNYVSTDKLLENCYIKTLCDVIERCNSLTIKCIDYKLYKYIGNLANSSEILIDETYNNAIRLDKIDNSISKVIINGNTEIELSESRTCLNIKIHRSYAFTENYIDLSKINMKNIDKVTINNDFDHEICVKVLCELSCLSLLGNKINIIN